MGFLSGDFLAGRLPELWLRTSEHMFLTGVSTAAAILAGIPLGIVALRYGWLRGFLLGAIGVLQTVPSLAMLAILLALLQKIGALPAIIALTLYALLPIVRNTLTGLQNVPAEALDAARGIGMTERQQMWMVRFPLAAPVVVAGIRTAAVVGVGIATLSAFIGAGGLGQFINRGLALSNTDLILLGAVPAAALALLVDLSIGAVQWGLGPVRQRERGSFRARLRPLALSAPLWLIAAGFLAYFGGRDPEASASASVPSESGKAAPEASIRLGSKNFTEQLIVAELTARLLEQRAGLGVERRFNLGGTMICHQALTSGEIDLYIEYTGTGLTAILKQPVIDDRAGALEAVRQAYRERFGAEWLQPLGFNSTYAIAVRAAHARQQGWERISDLIPDAAELRAGFTAEFAERPDGYPGLQERYGMRFQEVRDLDPAIMYDAVAKNEVDVICAFATDGRIAAYHLKPLVDDRKFFPPYDAVPVVRREILRAYPEVRSALEPLGGLIDEATMQRLNSRVDIDKRSTREVVEGFLQEKKLLE